MTLKDLFSKIKRRSGPMAIESIWAIGLALALILLFVALWADYFLIYKKFVVEKLPPAQFEASGSFLKKNNLVNAGKKIREEKTFLDNPAFQFVESPF
ncbi:MAG: hypothetical protein Q8Q46_01065 [Candidatus Giovannonibacteria bacterium]|nr:hypothetical protein [Candidatus Giovannonibacteria bacterium]